MAVRGNIDAQQIKGYPDDSTKYLRGDGTWATTAGAGSPTTTEGDLIVRGASADQRLAIGTNSQVLTVDTSVSGKVKWATASSGSGGLLPWVTWTAPVDGDWSWVNQGGASITSRSSPTRLLLTAPAGSGSNLRIRTRSAPSAPYTRTFWLFPHLNPGATTPNCGVGFRESSSGKVRFMSIVCSSGNDWYLQVLVNNSPTSWNSTPVSRFAWSYTFPASGIPMQISDDNTNCIFRTTQNGEDWHDIYTVGRTNFLTPDEIFWYAEAQDATYDAGCLLVSYA